MGVLLQTLLLTAGFAFVANLALDLEYADGSAARLHAVADELPIFLLGALVVWSLVLLVLSVTGRLWLSLGLVTVALGLLGFANHRKQQLVLEPVFPADLAFLVNPGFLAQMVGPWVVVAALVASVALVAAAGYAGRGLSRWFPRPGRGGGRRAWGLRGARVVGVVVSSVLLVQAASFHDPGNWLREAYGENGARWRPLHQRLNYADNGVVAGLLYNLPVPAMARPDDYGSERMRELADRYARVADRINRRRHPDALEDVNVVFVLSEAFSDPTLAPGVSLAEDPMPFTRSLMRRTTSGAMWAPEYGRGTANTEFEALTGLSLSQLRPQVSTPFTMVLPHHDAFPSAASALASEGHGTLALHSYTSELYRRAEAYPVLGFEDVVFRDGMSHTAPIDDNPFVSDAATFEELTTHLETADAPQLVNVVTMQNHYPMAGKYDDPIPVTGLDDAAAAEQLEHYARGLRHSDRALEELVTELETSQEKTVLVFYGDHLPVLWPPSTLDARARHETPFFVHANFGRPHDERLPTTSPIYFMNHVLERADAEVTPFHALLELLQREVPAMGEGVMIGPDDERLASDQLSPTARRLLHDYRLVQYDLMVGQQHVVDELFRHGT